MDESPRIPTALTSTIDIGLANELSVVHLGRSDTRQKIIGPSIGSPGSPSYRVGEQGQHTGFETPLTSGLVPHSAQEAVEMARLRLDSGADMVNFQDGALPLDYYKAAAFEEVHKAGKPVFHRATGPTAQVKDGVLAGADVIPHSAGIAVAVTRDPSKWTNELDAYSDMDDAKAAELVQSPSSRHKVTTGTHAVSEGNGISQRVGQVCGAGSQSACRPCASQLLWRARSSIPARESKASACVACRSRAKVERV